MPNIALLRRTMDLVELAAPKGEWNQHFYRNPIAWRDGGPCGTALCFAGWTVIAAGAEFADDHPFHFRYGMVADDFGGCVDIPVWAARALGLSMFEAGELFNPDNTLEDLRTIVEYHCHAVEAAA